MRAFLLLLLLGGCAARPPRPLAAPGPEEAAVMATVQRLFDAMRAGDSATVRSVFHPEATLASVGERDGASVLQRGTSVDAFVRAVGSPHPERWDERIWNPEVRVDGDLATAWMDYAFYLGDRLSHCGVNAFQLVRGPRGWQVFHIADTRRRQGCAGPTGG